MDEYDSVGYSTHSSFPPASSPFPLPPFVPSISARTSKFLPKILKSNTDEGCGKQVSVTNEVRVQAEGRSAV